MISIFNKTADAWRWLSGIGTKDLDYDESRRIVLCNQIATLGVITMLGYDGIYLVYDPVLLLDPITVNLSGALVCVCALYLNYLRRHDAARLLIYLSVNVQIYLLTWYLGTVTGMHLLHIMMISFAGFFFAREPLPRLVVLLLFPMLLFFIEYFLFVPAATPIMLDPGMVHFLYVTLSSTVFILVIIFFTLFYNEILRTEDLLQKEYRRSEGLLLNILPAEIVRRLKQDGDTVADSYPSVTILFADLVGFTDVASRLEPEVLVGELNELYQEYDRLIESYGLEKIKTLGDAYMVAGGIPVANDHHMETIAGLALDMRELTRNHKISGNNLDLRIGFHTGPVVAGVIGKHKFSYDVWGDAVNLASRLESTGEPGRIHVSEFCYRRLRNEFLLEARGETEIKGMGSMRTYFLTGRRYSAGVTGGND